MTKTFPDLTGVTYTYDALSRLTHASDPSGTYSFAYDNLGRLTGTTTSYSFLARTLTMSYNYDAASNRVSLTDPESGITNYSYDALNRLTGLIDFAGGNFAFSYDALGRRTNLTRPNGVNTNYSYDAISHLLSVVHSLGPLTVDGASYTYDGVGNRTSKTVLAANVTSSYAYDSIYQLAQVTQGASTTESYSYDSVGNRVSSLGVSPYSYNSSNELTSKPGVAYTYDPNGNLTGKIEPKGTTSYTWDIESRLATITFLNGSSFHFRYDPFGRRIQSDAVGRIFVYDGDNLVEELDTTGKAVARYTASLSIDEPLEIFQSGAASYYEADGLGSITSLTDPSGAPAASYTYDSFGVVMASTSSVGNRVLFTGRENVPKAGLYYYRARYYDPSVGRFLSEDPAQFNFAINLYAYSYNNPATFIDPLGLRACCPKEEEREIKRRIEFIRRVLSALERTGTALSAGATKAGGMTFCQSFRLPNGMELPPQATTQIKIDKDKQPCLFKCADAHEAVHRRACISLGPHRYIRLSEAQKELPAYTTELGCFLFVLRSAGISISF